MDGLMMPVPLTLPMILRRAVTLFPDREIVSRLPSGVHRTNWGEIGQRVDRLANALAGLGVEPGTRVATFGWNHFRHLEAYFAIPSMGAVMHNLNIRLHQDQLSYIANHAQDEVLLVDASLLPIALRFLPKATTIRHLVVMGGKDVPVEIPGDDREVHSYEGLIQEASGDYIFPELKETQAAGLCYTSGTTGDPKGVCYSHRAFVLHSMMSAMADTFALCEEDTALCVVPMFHANAWGIPYTGAMVGAGLVFPGPFMKPEQLAELMAAENVTIAAGVPTLWNGLYHHLKENDVDLSSLNRMVVGGSAAPRSLIKGFEEEFGIPIVHAWGMTETTPLGTVSRLRPEAKEAPAKERYDIRATQGRPVFGVDLRIVGEDQSELPWDGESMGEIQVRGPWVCNAYFQDDRSDSFTSDGWFRTGDVGVVDEHGYMEIRDRTKDLVKSGGEWISSVALENAIMAHPEVKEACVIAVPDEEWTERPLAVVVPLRGSEVTDRDIRDHLSGRFPKWWLPDQIVFDIDIPKTSVGKFDKKVLRQRFENPGVPPEE